MDKVQKIREEVKMVVNRRLNLLNGDYFDLNKEADGFTNEIMDIIDPLQEEPVSENKCMFTKDSYADEDRKVLCEDCKEKCEYNKKENLWKPADGDDLPIFDREVIAILDYDFGHYKVVYAHRPNPNGWNGTNIDTGEEEHFEPAIYGKGGWNQPHVLYWLDTRLPYEENKIIKEL